MIMNANQTYCDDPFTVYTNNKSLCCGPETNVICQLFLDVKIKNIHLIHLQYLKKETNSTNESDNISLLIILKIFNIFA